jgi:hypothetical protein
VKIANCGSTPNVTGCCKNNKIIKTIIFLKQKKLYTMFKNFFWLLFSVVCATQSLLAQSLFEIPATNSHSVIQQQIASTYINVEYNRPNIKGRKIFGGLIPFGKIWRTGSDASTKLYFSTPVYLNNHPLDSGTYEIFTIPNSQEWTIILQQSKSQWGSYSYKIENDVLRFTVKREKIAKPLETFTISFDKITSKSAELSLNWEKTRVPIFITIDLIKTVVPKLEESLLVEGRKPYFKAAMFYFENNIDIGRAAALMQLAINENPNHLGMLYRQALILERMGDKEKAIESSEKSLMLANSAGEELKAEYIKLNTTLLKRLRKN